MLLKTLDRNKSTHFPTYSPEAGDWKRQSQGYDIVFFSKLLTNSISTLGPTKSKDVYSRAMWQTHQIHLQEKLFLPLLLYLSF